MSVTRRAVLEQLAEESNAQREEMTTIADLARSLDSDEHTVARHLNGLVSCELARMDSNERIRVTITGEELLERDTGGTVIVDSAPED